MFPGNENWGNEKLGNVNWVMDQKWVTKSWGMEEELLVAVKINNNLYILLGTSKLRILLFTTVKLIGMGSVPYHPLPLLCIGSRREWAGP